MPRVIAEMSPSQITDMVARTKGARLRALLDAAQDVAQASYDRALRAAAQAIIAAGRISHPEYFNPTLRGC